MSSHSNRACTALGARSVAIGGALCPSDTADQQKEPKMLTRSCDQLCPITADHISATCQCPSVPAVSAHPCHLPVPISATSMPHFSAHQCHINATYQCLSELPFSVTHQCHSANYQCQCHLSVPPYQCQSVPQCRLSVPVSAAYQ
ncbi:unnamed protein product, partial [Staurois parvus]